MTSTWPLDPYCNSKLTPSTVALPVSLPESIQTRSSLLASVATAHTSGSDSLSDVPASSGLDADSALLVSSEGGCGEVAAG
jgi:hypothetical protein